MRTSSAGRSSCLEEDAGLFKHGLLFLFPPFSLTELNIAVDQAVGRKRIQFTFNNRADYGSVALTVWNLKRLYRFHPLFSVAIPAAISRPDNGPCFRVMLWWRVDVRVIWWIWIFRCFHIHWIPVASNLNSKGVPVALHSPPGGRWVDRGGSQQRHEAL